MKLQTVIILLLVSLLVFPTNNLKAQKARMSDEKVSFSYMKLPINANKKELTTYTTAIVADPGLSALVNTSYYEKSLLFHGKKKIDAGGHFLLEVRLSAPTFTGRKVDKQTKTTENKEGKKTTTTTYKASCSYNIPTITYKLVDYENNYLVDGEYPGASGIITPKAQSSSNSANTKLNEEIQKRINSNLSEGLAYITNHVSSQYGYQKIDVAIPLYKMKSQKHPEFDKFNKAFSSASKNLASLKSGIDPTNVHEQIKPQLDYWSSLADGISNDDKKASKLKFACLYNIAQANIWLGNMGEAQTYLAKLDDLSKKDFLVSSLKKTQEALASQLSRYPELGLYSIYEIGETTPPASVSYEYDESVVAEKLNLPTIPTSDNQTLETGTITLNGQTHEAYFVLLINEIEGSPQSFEPKKGFKIYPKRNDEYKPIGDFMTEIKQGDYFTLDDVKYKFKRSTEGRYWNLTEIYYESDAIKCYSENSMNKRPIFPKIRVKRSDATLPWSPNLISEKKSLEALSIYFIDCPKITLIVDENEDSTAVLFKKIGEHYTENCANK